jgi:phosphoribosyl 1,2-cyclic phosphodiesterase
MPLPHPGLNTAFRMYSNNFDFVYASDVEAEQSSTIEDIAMFSKNTQYIFIDSSYTDKELKERLGWGHLSYQQVIDLAKRLKNSKVLIFHHDFLRSDQELDEILSNVLPKSNNLSVCRELSEFKF